MMISARERPLQICTCLVLLSMWITTSAAAQGLARKRVQSPKSPSAIIVAGTVVMGAFDPRTVRTILEVLPRRPETIVFVDIKELPSAHEKQFRGLDGFVPIGSRVVYLNRQSPTLRAAEFEGGPYLLMLAAVVWHEMAHTEGLDERQARQREEDLWKQFVQRSLVDSGIGLTYLNELRQRR
jgi:hypothetical protein